MARAQPSMMRFFGKGSSPSPSSSSSPPSKPKAAASSTTAVAESHGSGAKAVPATPSSTSSAAAGATRTPPASAAAGSTPVTSKSRSRTAAPPSSSGGSRKGSQTASSRRRSSASTAAPDSASKAVSNPWPEGVPSGRFLVGRRVRVWWPAMSAHFAGRVIAYDRGTGVYGIEYDDGEKEAVRLADEQWEAEAKPAEAGATAGAASSVATSSSSSSSASSSSAAVQPLKLAAPRAEPTRAAAKKRARSPAAPARQAGAESAPTGAKTAAGKRATGSANKGARATSSRAARPARSSGAEDGLFDEEEEEDDDDDDDDDGSEFGDKDASAEESDEDEDEDEDDGMVPESEALAELGAAAAEHDDEDESGIAYDDELPPAPTPKRGKKRAAASPRAPSTPRSGAASPGAASPRAASSAGRGASAAGSAAGGVPVGSLPVEAPQGGWQVMGAAVKTGSGVTPFPCSVSAAAAGAGKKDLKGMLFRFGEHEHHRLAFVRDRCDAAGRRPGDAGFDPRTLRVPPAHIKACTGAQQQWWEVKSKHMDTVLCFKVGKFYETYHMDADVVVRELDCVYMKGYEAHAGFPEIAFGRMSEALVQKGYRVARVEQTETPDMLAERKKAMSSSQPKPKCVARELCSMKSMGTRRFHAVDRVELGSDLPSSAKAAMLAAQGAAEGGDVGFLLSVCEAPLAPAAKEAAAAAAAASSGQGQSQASAETPETRIGIAVADVASARVFLGSFEDGPSRSRLRTMVARLCPAELVLPLGEGPLPLSAATQRFLRYDCPEAVVAALPARLWPSQEAARRLCSVRKYFASAGGALPRALAAVLDDGADADAGSAAAVAATAFGALAVHLRRSLLDIEVLSTASYGTYDDREGLVAPSLDTLASSSSSSSSSSSAAAAGAAPAVAVSAAERALAAARALSPGGLRLLLDASSLVNLEVLGNSVDGSKRGSLLEAVGRCTSAAGQRLFRSWLCAPLRTPAAIEDRLDAVELLMPAGALASQAAEARKLLSQMPDLDRLASRLEAGGSKRLAEELPQGRAIMYERPAYAKRQVADLARALAGLRAARKLRQLFHVPGTTSSSAAGTAQFADPSRPPREATLLPEVTASLLERATGAAFPVIGRWVDDLEASFDVEEARRSGRVLPKPGANPDYDGAVSSVQDVKAELAAYLDTQKDRLRCHSLRFWGTGGGASNAASVNDKRFQIEVPEAVASSSALPSEYELKSQRKGAVRRYHTKAVSRLLEKLSAAEAEVEAAVEDTMRALCERFATRSAEIEAAGRCCAVLDCLLGLASWSSEGDGAGPMCRPEVVERVAEGRGSTGSPSAAGEREGAKSTAAFLQVRAGRHPCVTRLLAERGAGTYVPNDIDVGLEQRVGAPREAGKRACVLLTGPNMGGKSTYLRQAAVATLLAQVGAYVPAESCRLTPADRVFTRVGASDRILAGQSTFYVELSETAAIVNGATEDSLVILDELGRGTSTFDGNAIAWAVTRHLTGALHCRALFATHYHTLTEEFAADPSVVLGHMACFVEQSAAASGKAADDRVTFLYRFASGGCPKSYGLNVARLANLPEDLIRRAGERSAEFEDALAQAIEQTQGEAAARAARGVGGHGSSEAALAAEAKRVVTAHGGAAKASDDEVLALMRQAAAMAADQ